MRYFHCHAHSHVKHLNNLIVFRAFDESRSINLIKESLKCGVNYLETGPWYGQGSSERTIGKVKDAYLLWFTN